MEELKSCTLLEFIKFRNLPTSIEDRERELLRILDQDDSLPYDFLGIDESGNRVKKVYLSADEDKEFSISVYDLLMFDKKDISEMSETDPIRVCFEAYMEEIDIDDPTIFKTFKMLEDWKESRRK